MTKEQLIQTLKSIKFGSRFPGTIKGKTYTYIGLQEYSTYGKYSQLKGAPVAVIKSDNRKRSLIRLFIEPLLLMVNSRFEDLTYGNLPSEYMRIYHTGAYQMIPNLYEYESHYKCLAQYIKRLTINAPDFT